MNGQTPQTKTAPLILLAGGKGSRLSAIQSHLPKPMVEIGGRPFSHWLVAHYRSLGHQDFLFSIGHKAEVFEQYPWQNFFSDCNFRFETETSPLGTGGAIVQIYQHHTDLDGVWIINADTFLPQPLPPMPNEVEALYVALEGSEIFDATPNLHFKDNRVIAVKENGQYFDGGAIFTTRRAIERFHGSAPCSLHDVLQPSMSAGKVGCAIMPGTCYDIGTPERFRRFEEYLKDAAAKKN